MSPKEYFGKWCSVIDYVELQRAIHSIKNKELICPRYSDIFRAFNLCLYENCKVVFVGQDPYPQKDVATGLAFGNKKDVKSLSPSLEVLKECAINFEIPHNYIIFDQTLESWAEQGVLLLNSALTCEIGKPNSHAQIWRSFTSKLLFNLANKNQGLIYVLFGSQAKTFKPYINRKLNDIIEVGHPSYYARTGKNMPYSVFENINKLIKSKYNTTIEWYKELNYEEENSMFWPNAL